MRISAKSPEPYSSDRKTPHFPFPKWRKIPGFSAMSECCPILTVFIAECRYPKFLKISPIDGVILEKKVDVNTIGISGTIAFVIGSIDDIEAEAYVLSDDVSNIKLGNEVEIIERSDKKQIIYGRVIKIAPSAVTMTSSLGVNQRKVCITIGKLEGTAPLKPGYEVDVKIITDRKNNIVKVPLSATFEYKGQDCVFVLQSGRATLRNVRKGIEDGYHAEIISGLKDGELVLSEADNSIREGMRIKPDKSKE